MNTKKNATSIRLTSSVYFTAALIVFLGTTLIKQQGVNGQQDNQSTFGRQGRRAPVVGGASNNEINNEISTGPGTQTSNTAFSGALALPNFSSSTAPASSNAASASQVPNRGPALLANSKLDSLDLDGKNRGELDQLSTRQPPNRRPVNDNERARPVRPRPYSSESYYDGARDKDEDEDDCFVEGDEEYFDDIYAHPGLRSMILNPMRQFSRMFNDAFDQMRPNFNYGRGPSSGSSVSTSSSSAYNSAGPYDYSRVQSTVTNNGRTRGIVTETRNGRTQTKRFGDDYEE